MSFREEVRFPSNYVEFHHIKKVKNFMFDLYDQIGSGYSSKVYKGKECKNGFNVAIKVIELKKLTNDIERILLTSQAQALSSIDHPNLLKSLQVMQTVNNFYIVTELFQDNLQNKIKTNGKFSQLETINFLLQMTNALIYLSKKRIIHRDVKLSNIFLSKTFYVLGDFGFCFYADSLLNQKGYNIGSPMYMSPESYKKCQYSFKSDLWSLGICAIELLCGYKPFTKMTYQEMIRQICELKFHRNLNISEKLKLVLDWILQYDVERRKSSIEIIQKLNQTEDISNMSIYSIMEPNEPNKNNDSPDSYSYKTIQHKRSESVGFPNREYQLNFKNTHKRRKISSKDLRNLQRNYLTISVENERTLSFKSSQKTIHKFKTQTIEQEKEDKLEQLSKSEVKSLQDLFKLLLTDTKLTQSVNKLKILRLLSLIPGNRFPVAFSILLHSSTSDKYFQYVISTINYHKMRQISHYFLFLLKEVIQQYEKQIKTNAYDQNCEKRIQGLRRCEEIWRKNMNLTSEETPNSLQRSKSFSGENSSFKLLSTHTHQS